MIGQYHNTGTRNGFPTVADSRGKVFVRRTVPSQLLLAFFEYFGRQRRSVFAQPSLRLPDIQLYCSLVCCSPSVINCMMLDFHLLLFHMSHSHFEGRIAPRQTRALVQTHMHTHRHLYTESRKSHMRTHVQPPLPPTIFLTDIYIYARALESAFAHT